MKYRVLKNSPSTLLVGGKGFRRPHLLVLTSILAVACSAVPEPPVARIQGAEPRILGSQSMQAPVLLPDYSYAGYRFGLEPLPAEPGTIIYASDYGVIPDDGKDDSRALLQALDAAAEVSGRVTLLLPPGRIQLSEIIPIERSELILQGAGSGEGGTELFFPRPLSMVDRSDRQDQLREYLVRENKIQREPDQNINMLFSEYSWSGGFLLVGPAGTTPVSYDPATEVRPATLTDVREGRQFERELIVDSAEQLAVGQVVQVLWYSDDGAESSILKSMYGTFEDWNSQQTDVRRMLHIGSHHWTFPNRPVVAQTTRIVNIDGSRIELGDPLLHDISGVQPAIVAEWEHLSNVGIQDMRLTFPHSAWFGHHLEQGYNGIYLTGVFDGWVSNLVIENADSGILTDNAASLTISDVTTKGEHTAHYSVHIGAVHNVLVTGLRVENRVVHPLSVNTRATRSVYQRAVVLKNAIIDQHSGSNHQNLFDQIVLRIEPHKSDGGAFHYQLWRGGGADYWKPGHGLYNTHWNIRLETPNSDALQERVHISSGLEGPGARIVGLHADFEFDLTYWPTPYTEMIGEPVHYAPSLYDYQLSQRRKLMQASGPSLP